MELNLHPDTVVWIMCDCYVWPTYWWSMSLRGPGCGRCHSSTKLLDPNKIRTRQQAHNAYRELNGKFPEPIK